MRHIVTRLFVSFSNGLFLINNDEDRLITLKINMFRKLVKYILDNKPETATKKPTFIFFDDEAQQLFSVGLVGLAMYKQINLFFHFVLHH